MTDQQQQEQNRHESEKDEQNRIEDAADDNRAPEPDTQDDEAPEPSDPATPEDDGNADDGSPNVDVTVDVDNSTRPPQTEGARDGQDRGADGQSSGAVRDE